VPLPAELVFDDGRRVVGTVDDLTGNGLRFYGGLPARLTAGAPVTGHIPLPDGPLPLWGEVRSLLRQPEDTEGPRAIGCSFDTTAEGRHRLESFLFGTDLQWHVNGYTDQVHTPLSRLLPRQVPGPAPHPLAGRRWNAAQLRRHPAAAPLPALVAEPDTADEQPLILSYAALPTQHAMQLQVFRRSEVPHRGVRLEPLALANDASGLFHTYRAQPAPLPAPVPDDPRDTQPAFLLMREAIEAARQDHGEPTSTDVHPSTL
jgi:cellulose synthase (UDP-forming)